MGVPIKKRQRPMTKKTVINVNEIHIGKEKMKTREDMRMVKLYFISQNFLLWAYIKKIAHLLFGAWSFLLRKLTLGTCSNT